jgi:hypothetical protein
MKDQHAATDLNVLAGKIVLNVKSDLAVTTAHAEKNV